jgi:chromate transporter
VPDSRPSLATLGRLFLRFGAIAFGGPLAHVALFRRELVEKRRWVSDDDFADAFGVTNLVPGPNSTELAIHTGYLLRGVRGGLVSGIAFALPAVLLMLGLSAAYFADASPPVPDDALLVLRAVVIAVIVATLWKLRGSVTTRWLQGVAVCVALLTVLVPGWEPAWLLLAALAGWARYAWTTRPRVDDGFVLVDVLLVFLRTGALLFGGGLALVPLLREPAVAHGWLTAPQFLDGIALGQLTPGPIVTSAAFVGFAAAGWLGGIVATLALYLPSFVIVLGGTGPFLRRFAAAPWLRPTIAAVTAGALGAIAMSCVALAMDAVTGWWTAAVAVTALVAILRGVPAWAVALGGLVAGLVAAAL